MILPVRESMVPVSRKLRPRDAFDSRASAQQPLPQLGENLVPLKQAIPELANGLPFQRVGTFRQRLVFKNLFAAGPKYRVLIPVPSHCHPCGSVGRLGRLPGLPVGRLTGWAGLSVEPVGRWIVKNRCRSLSSRDRGFVSTRTEQRKRSLVNDPVSVKAGMD